MFQFYTEEKEKKQKRYGTDMDTLMKNKNRPFKMSRGEWSQQSYEENQGLRSIFS